MRLSRRQFLVGLASVSVPGCVTIPSPAAVSEVARSVGGSAGLALSECFKSDEVRRALAATVTRIVRIVPDVGQDRESLWTYLARTHVNDLVARGKMKSTVGCLVLAAFRVVLHAFSILESRYPEIRKAREYMDAAVDGFGKGFVSTFYGSDDATSTIDVQAYHELKASPDIAVIRMLSSTAN